MFLIYTIDIVATLVVVYLALRGGIERALPAFCFILLIVPGESVIHLGDWFALTVDRILIVVLVILFFSLRRGSPRLAGVNHPVAIVIVLHIIWSGISTAHSVVPLISLKAATAAAVEYYIIYFIFTHSITSVRTIHKILAAVVLAVAICSVIGAYEAYANWVMVQSWFPRVEYRFYATFADMERGARARASFAHPILFGSAIALAIPMALYLLTVFKRSLHRILLWTAILVMFLAMYKTMSRGPWLALAVSLAILLFLGAKTTRKHILAMAGLALFVLLTRPGVWDTLSSLYTSTMDPDTPAGMSYYYRYSLYNAAFEAVNANFERQLWGYGPESFYYLHLVGEYMGKPTKIDSCDSAWVELMVDTGYVGLALIASILFVPAFHAFKRWRKVRGPDRHLLLLLVVNMMAYYFMMVSVMLYGWGQQTYILWFLIPISVVYPAILKCRAKREVPAIPQISESNQLPVYAAAEWQFEPQSSAR